MQPAAQRRYINVFLGLGSNMGNRASHLAAAMQMIQKEIGKVAKKSHVYETEPWGNKDQEAFLNQVIMVNTTLEPRDLLAATTFIERSMGRERKEKWGPRTIDIDILFYGKRVIRDRGLEIPHPELHKRAFVLAPLLEIAPDYEHPLLKKPIDELYMDCEDPSDVVQLS
jgi:2-amino-4-hydroxy-6-hydroxymethyldihydropteridine diphosphokinase